MLMTVQLVSTNVVEMLSSMIAAHQGSIAAQIGMCSSVEVMVAA